MKFVVRMFLLFAGLMFLSVALIKFIQGCSWKEAVGIAEELLKEI